MPLKDLEADLSVDPKKLVVLAVDDERTNLTFIRFGLKFVFNLDKQQIEEAYDIQTGLTILRNRKDISIVLMDINFPVGTGFEATESIRAEGNEVPVVIMTSSSKNNMLEEQAKETGANGFLYRPAKELQLKEAISKAILKDPFFVIDTQVE